jgi:hypothetical protein
MYIIAIIIAISLLFGNLLFAGGLGGDVIEVKPIILTTVQKTEVADLLTKEATGKLNYEEAVKYIKALNDYTTTRKFTNTTMQGALTTLKDELYAKTK